MQHSRKPRIICWRFFLELRELRWVIYWLRSTSFGGILTTREVLKSLNIGCSFASYDLNNDFILILLQNLQDSGTKFVLSIQGFNLFRHVEIVGSSAQRFPIFLRCKIERGGRERCYIGRQHLIVKGFCWKYGGRLRNTEFNCSSSGKNICFF